MPTLREPALERALAAGLLSASEPAAMFFDLDAVRSRCAQLRVALPEAVHALAIKACPLPPLLRLALDAGLALEVASEGELALAAHVGAPPDRVLFDSPAKTCAELDLALRWGVHLHIDNLQELARVADRIGRHPENRPASVGLRINPGVTGGRIAATFTGGVGSKFGVDLEAHRDEILAAYDAWPWLDALHVHIGSQGCPLDVLVAGIRRVVDLAGVLAARGRAPRWVDIGGGLPVRYRPEDPAPTFAAYRDALAAGAPDLFAGPWRVVTEFGRALLAPCAFAASLVEYTRPERIAVVHFGADLLPRAAYGPKEWSHRIDLYDPTGRPKTGRRTNWSVAGPLCFSGDFVARDRPMPTVEPGDVVLVRDVGAYTLGMWSRYNSRPVPAVYGFQAARSGFSVLKPRERLVDVLRFWGVGGDAT
jgi:diaminopimelate decarboxylase